MWSVIIRKGMDQQEVLKTPNQVTLLIEIFNIIFFNKPGFTVSNLKGKKKHTLLPSWLAVCQYLVSGTSQGSISASLTMWVSNLYFHSPAIVSKVVVIHRLETATIPGLNETIDQIYSSTSWNDKLHIGMKLHIIVKSHLNFLS